jgi:hypothetical protein
VCEGLEGVRVKRRNQESEVSVTIKLPPEAYFWVEYAARHKGLSVGQHIREWIIRSLEPWDEEEPLPLDAHSVYEVPFAGDREAPGRASEDHPKPWDVGPKREDFADLESFLKAERVERNARAQATRRKTRATQPKVLGEHIKAIAEARRQHATMSLRQFSQFLFDEDIYQSWGWGPYPAKPVNSATLSVWLRQAREAGLLPEKAKTVAYPPKS